MQLAKNPFGTTSLEEFEETINKMTTQELSNLITKTDSKESDSNQGMRRNLIEAFKADPRTSDFFSRPAPIIVNIDRDDPINKRLFNLK